MTLSNVRILVALSTFPHFAQQLLIIGHQDFKVVIPILRDDKLDQIEVLSQVFFKEVHSSNFGITPPENGSRNGPDLVQVFQK